MGDKQNAIDSAREGLKKILQSKYLHWQLEQLGVKVAPLLKPDSDNKDASNAQPTSPRPREDIKPLEHPTVPEGDASISTSPTKDNTSKEIMPASNRPNGNPYCRFCP